jgi:hypothetical protein
MPMELAAMLAELALRSHEKVRCDKKNVILLTNSPPPHHAIHVGLHPGTELRYFVVEQ